MTPNNRLDGLEAKLPELLVKPARVPSVPVRVVGTQPPFVTNIPFDLALLRDSINYS